MRPQVKVLLALIPFSFILGSCQKEDLSAAEKFGDLALSLEKANEKISDDIYGSCTRNANWVALGTAASRRNSQERLAVCDQTYLPNSKNTKIAGSVLVDYVAAVGNLATEKNADFTPQLNKISGALGRLDIDAKTRTAGVKIAEFITNLLVRDFRRDNLKVAIVCTDPDIQEYSAKLSNFIESSYVRGESPESPSLLDQEIAEIQDNYGFYIGEVNRRLVKLSESQEYIQDFKTLVEEQTLLEAQQRAEVSKVIERKKDGSDYVEAIRTTAEFHGKLKLIFNNNREELSSAQIKKCNEYRSNSASARVENTNQEDNSWNQKITASELNQAQKVAKEYINKITPLLKEIED
jgi:hypothetical protein